MKKRDALRYGFLLVGMLLLLGACSERGGEPGVAEGERLFRDPALAGSANAMSCEACHPGGEGLRRAIDNPRLLSVINACIAGPLEGKPLAEDSVELLSLKLYVESIGAGEAGE